MNQGKDEVKATEQEGDAEAAKDVEPVRETGGEGVEEETQDEFEEHESEQIEGRRIKKAQEEKRKRNENASASEKSDAARGRASDDGYETREG